MKFSVLSILLFSALVSVAVGWLWERTELQQKLSSITDSQNGRATRISIGSALYGDVSRTTELMKKLIDDVDYRVFATNELVEKLLEIYENQDDIECFQFRQNEFDARLLSREVLSVLNCETSDSFFEIARTVDCYPDFYDSDQREHRALRQFLEDTIAIKDQWYDNGFQDDPRDQR